MKQYCVNMLIKSAIINLEHFLLPKTSTKKLLLKVSDHIFNTCSIPLQLKIYEPSTDDLDQNRRSSGPKDQFCCYIVCEYPKKT